MKWSEITEARLPLLPNGVERLRGSYAAFVIVMSPTDFLKLTASPEDLEYIRARDFPQDRETFVGDGGDEEQLGRFSMPFLKVVWPSGRVKGHEGRHRALMIQRQGGNSFPVAIFLYYEDIHEVSYERWDRDTDESTREIETFVNGREAVTRREELRKINDLDNSIHYFDVRHDTKLGGAAKGSPNQRNEVDPWDHKAFTVDDMPKRLLAQYDSNIEVTRYRVGLVKGYRHFS